MKVACILYHSNILSIYKKEWIERCLSTIVNQTYQDFDIYELNYGDDSTNLKEMFNFQKNHFFYNLKMNNHAEAMNFLLDLIFKEQNYDYCFNVNLDDYYITSRFEKQLEVMRQGFDVVSSDYVFVRDRNNRTEISGPVGLGLHDIQTLFNMDITPMAHPCVCYSKKFWIEHGPYVPEEIPREDKNLWIRSYTNGAKLFIIKEPLLFYRLHEKQVSGSN